MVQPSERRSFAHWLGEHKALFFGGMAAFDLVLLVIGLTVVGVLSPPWSWF